MHSVVGHPRRVSEQRRSGRAAVSASALALLLPALALGIAGCRRSRTGAPAIETLARARQLAKAGKLDPALDLYRRLLKSPDVNRSRIALEAALLCHARKIPDGVLYFTDFVAENAPERRTADNLVVSALLRKQDMDRLTAFLQKRWNNPQTRLWAGPYLAEQYAASGDFIKAEAIYRKLIHLQPDHLDWRLALARLELREKRFPAARKEFEKILEKDPKNLAALMGLATLAVRDRRWDAAESFFRRAHAAAPEAPDPLLGLAFLKISEKQRAAALELYERALGLPAPPYSKLFPYLDLLFGAGNRKKLKTLARSPARPVPADEQAFHAYAAGLLALLDHDGAGAKTALEKALAVFPKIQDAAFFLHLARARLEAGQVEGAAKLLERARKLAPLGPEGFSLLAEIALRRQDYRAAQHWIRMLPSGDPRRPWLQTRCDAALARLREARRSLRPLLNNPKIAPRLKAANSLLEADALEQNGAVQSARALLADIAKQSGRDRAAAVLAKTKLLWSRGEKRQAIAELEQLANSATSPALRRFARILELRLLLFAGNRDRAAAVLAELKNEPFPSLPLYAAWLTLLRGNVEAARAKLTALPLKSGWDGMLRGVLLAACSLQRRDALGAAGNLDDACAAVKNPPPKLLLLARDAYWMAGKLELAAARAEKYRRLRPGDINNILVLSRFYAELGKKEKRLNLLKQAVRATPKNPEIIAEYIDALIAAGNLKQARDRVERRLNRNPKDPRFLLLAARIAFLARDSATLRRLVAALPPRTPEKRRGLLLLASDRTLAGDFSTALKTLASLPETDPQARYLHALILFRSGRLEAAQKELQTILKKTPDLAAAWFLRGRIALQQNRLETAEESFRKCLALRRDFVPALNNLAWTLHQERKAFSEALSCARLAARLAPKDPAVLDTLAALEIDLGEFSDAFGHAANAADSAPTFWRCYHAALAAFKLKKNHRAAQYLARARRLARSPSERAAAARLKTQIEKAAPPAP